jgi:hypothetical protein
MTTNAYAAKRALVDRLTTMTAAGQRLDGIQVAYKWPGATVREVCVYGGGVTFTHDAEQGVTDGAGDRLDLETATIGLYIRIVNRDLGDDDVRDADIQAETIGQIIGEELARDPKLAGGLSYTRISAGTGDYQATDDEVVTLLAYQIQVTSYL